MPQTCKSCIAYFQDLFRGYRLVPGPGGFVARRCLEIGKKFPSGDANSWQDSLRIVLEPSEGHGEPVSSEPNLWSGTELDQTYYHTISYHITHIYIIYIYISYHIILFPRLDSMGSLEWVRNLVVLLVQPKLSHLDLGRQRTFGHAGSIQYSIYYIWILT